MTTNSGRTILTEENEKLYKALLDFKEIKGEMVRARLVLPDGLEKKTSVKALLNYFENEGFFLGSYDKFIKAEEKTVIDQKKYFKVN